MLTDEDSSTPPGTPPDEVQVDFLLAIADKSGNQCIDAGELEELLTCWHTFIEHRTEFEEKMKKYDVSNTGTLSKDELKAYLTDLNGGIAVSDDEVDMVMKQADVLGDGVLHKIELQKATATWFGYVAEHEKSCCNLQ